MGLLNVFSLNGANLGQDFLLQYAEICLGLNYSDEGIKTLIDKKIILYRNYQKRFVINEGTDVDIEWELLQAGDQIGEIEDVVSLLKKYFSFPAVFAKEYYYQTGTPRIFEFVISNYPLTDLLITGDTDGFVNLVFDDKSNIKKVEDISRSQPGKAVLYGVFKNTTTIRELLREIEKTQKTIQNIASEDRVAQRELANILNHQETLLNHFIMSSLYGGSDEIAWLFNGRLLTIRSKRDLNRSLTQICNEVYPSTPVYRSELVNRSKLSSQIHTAKRIFFRHLVNHWNDEELGFDKDKFPPEKTIYLTLLKENGLVPEGQESFVQIRVNEKSGFKALWEHGEDFLKNAKKHRLPLKEFTDSLTKAPFKLKQGLIDFWVPTFFFLKRDDFALFGNGIYIPELREEVLELMAKSPKDYHIKAFDVEGIRLNIFNRYRQFLNQGTKTRLDNQAFVETIRPFLGFYRGLPEYAKYTNRLTKESIAVRKVISTATDPEKTFFEDFPLALGMTLAQLQKSSEAISNYIERLQAAVREIRTCHDELVNRFELYIVEEVLYGSPLFEEYKIELRSRYKAIKQHRLLPHHKTFLLRLASELDDRKAWLSSVAQAVVGKTLENLKDEDEQ